MTTIKRFLTLFLIATISAFSVHVWGANKTYNRINSTSALVSGSKYLIVCEDESRVFKASSASNGAATESVDVTITSNSITCDENFAFTITGGPTNWKITGANGSIGHLSGNNTLGVNTTVTNTITFSGSDAVIGCDSRVLRCNHNSGSPLFRYYNNTQQTVQLYKEEASSCTNTPTMSFTDATVNKTTDDNTYTQTVNISGKGSGQTVSYSSSDESIGTVNSSGVVTLKGKVGTTTITASVEASGTYCSASASYTINVTNAPINVTLYYKGTSTTLNNQPNPYTLPTTGDYVADACDAWTFDGWYNSSYAKNTSKPTYITQLTSSGSAYAVYKHTETSGASTPITRTMNSFDAISGYVGGDANISYAAAQGSAGTAPGVYSSIIRIYQNGGTLTITANNSKKISRVTIGSSMGTTVRYQVDEGTPSSNRNISANGTITTPDIDGGASSVTFTCMGTSSSTRLYLNYLSVTYSDDGGSSTTYYSTDAECGPKVQATASPWVTSSNGQFVKVEVPVTATNFDKNSTLSATVSGEGFSIVSWGANGNTVTKDVDLTTSLILAYNPTTYNTNADATITFNSNYSGSQTPVYTAGTVHGRSLPEKFVIAIKNGDQWYALPANMSGSGTYSGEAVSVDNINNPTKVTAGPATALYSLLNVYKTSGAGDRYAEYGTRVRFLGNEKE